MCLDAQAETDVGQTGRHSVRGAPKLSVVEQHRRVSRNALLAASIVSDGRVLCGVFEPTKKSEEAPTVALALHKNVAEFARAMRQWGRRRAGLTLVMPPDRVLTRELRLPSHDPQELRSMVDHEVEEFSPFDACQTQHGFVPMRCDEAGHAQTMVFVARNEDLVATCEPFAQQGVSVCALLPSSLAVSALLKSLPDRAPNRLCVLVNDGVLETVRLDEDRVFCSRVALLHGQEDESTLLSDEIANSIAFLNRQDDIAPTHACVQMVGLACDGIRQCAEQLTRLPQTRNVRLEPLPFRASGGCLPPEVLTAAVRLTGALLVRHERCAPQANLLPVHLTERRAQRARLANDVRWGLLCGLVALLGVTAIEIGNRRMEQRIHRIEAAVAPHLAVAAQVATKREQLRAMRGQLLNRGHFVFALGELSRHTPVGVFFTKLSISQDGKVTIDGVADSLQLAFEFPERLRRAEMFSGIQLAHAQQATAGGQPMIEFRCTCRASVHGRVQEDAR